MLRMRRRDAGELHTGRGAPEWISFQASLPVLVRDVRDAAKASAKEEKLTAFVERLKLLDAYLQDHDYLSGGSAPGLERLEVYLPCWYHGDDDQVL